MDQVSGCRSESIVTTTIAAAATSVPTATAIAAFAAAIAALAPTPTIATLATTTGGPWACFVYGEPPPIVILTVQTLDGRVGLVVIRHFHKAEPTTAARVAIAQNLCRAHQAVLLE